MQVKNLKKYTMKTKLTLLLLAFALMSSTCEADKNETSSNECQCKKVYYDYKIVGWTNGGVTPIWNYVNVGEETASTMDCASDTGNYVQIDNNSYYKIECE